MTVKNTLTKEQIEFQKQLIEGAKILIVVFAFVIAIVKYASFGVSGIIAVGIITALLYFWNDIVNVLTSVKKAIVG